MPVYETIGYERGGCARENCGHREIPDEGERVSEEKNENSLRDDVRGDSDFRFLKNVEQLTTYLFLLEIIVETSIGCVIGYNVVTV